MYTYEYLFTFSKTLFEKMGCSPEDATVIADVLLRAELRNISSHGLLRLKDYWMLVQDGRMNPKPNVRIVHESPGTAVVDGDLSFGMVSGKISMKLAIEKAKKAGTGWVATRNSNHFGIAGYYAMMALEHDMIGICLTNANPSVAPTFSVERMLGTNPISMAVPTKNQPPYVADFATTPIARGKISVAEKKGEKLPLGFVQDKYGHPSDDPSILREGGAILPLGGDRVHGSHKGYCLGSIVDILTGVISGANWGPFVPPVVSYLPRKDKQVGLGTGHFFGAMRIDAFMPADEFKIRMDEWIGSFRASRPVEGQEKVLIPGDVEREYEEILMKKGIELVPKVIEDTREVAESLGMEFKEPM
ncbi:MAG TPA: Ldh family oxidoreductase [Bacteroidales bacterium]|nr:Ldh family oxidoreductase [Bacteroidales bacterium]